jgi:hypothetical protein
MEEIVALLIQLVLEVGLQLLGSIGFDFATETRRTRGDGPNDDGCGWLIAFAVFGGICGGISLIFAPKLLLPKLGLRIANLVVRRSSRAGCRISSPVTCGPRAAPARGTTSGAASVSRSSSVWSVSPTLTADRRVTRRYRSRAGPLCPAGGVATFGLSRPEVAP